MKPANAPSRTPIVAIRGGLPRTSRRLRENRRLTVGYLGGSITEGAGASSPAQTSWRAKVSRWFSDEYPQVAIREIAAGWGGTGSDLGAFRCAQALVPAHADLVFIEFAVNDGEKPDVALVQRSVEGIIRHLRRELPEVEFAMIYCTSRQLSAGYGPHACPAAIRAHEEVAAHYGVPSVDVGRTLWQKIAAGDITWEQALPDGTHPSDLGHAVYANTVQGALAELLRASAQTSPALPRPLAENPFENGTLIPAERLSPGPGWRLESGSMGGRASHSLSCAEPDQPLRIDFVGQAVGLTFLVARDSGDLLWSIDGESPRPLSTWDRYAAAFERVHYRVLATRLPSGPHRLELRVAPFKQTGSTGHWIRLGGLLVDQTLT